MLYEVCLVGATGAVGAEILRLLEERNFPVKTLRCFASPKSLGKSISFRGEKIPLEILKKGCLSTSRLVFFCAGSSISKEWIAEAGGYVVDSSSAFRSDPSVPLVIPEINAHALKNNPKIAASPNCAATILLMPLFKLHRLFQVKRIVVSTYQAASGAGAWLLQELKNETLAHLEHRPYPHLLPFPYAFNLYPHNSKLQENGYVEEEIKMRDETRKILEDEAIQLSATCVRVPVLRAHSVSANVEFKKPFALKMVYEALEDVPGLKLFEDRAQNRFPTPFDATGKDDVFCGRFRIDSSRPNTLEFWAVGDQLLKGAALNAVQIAETALETQNSEALL
ncbi:MAG: aspartate-semialdehyde dehydrogenase [Chlamydiae bacterium RIFCSPHIGHO2_12_FULL_49_9]|nr:MAG: aspartate-semialdehyde dehydrogenase [Chlamydiae bacterium RIFCSPHIGHO2_12_FULL_49_9]